MCSSSVTAPFWWHWFNWLEHWCLLWKFVANRQSGIGGTLVVVGVVVGASVGIGVGVGSSLMSLHSADPCVFIHLLPSGHCNIPRAHSSISTQGFSSSPAPDPDPQSSEIEADFFSYPISQSQLKPPKVFVHVVDSGQLWSSELAHSSMSVLQVFYLWNFRNF